MTPSDFVRLEESHLQLKAKVDIISQDLKTNTEATSRVEKNTSEIVQAFNALKGGLAVLGWLGSAGKTLLWLGVPFAAAATWWDHIKVIFTHKP